MQQSILEIKRRLARLLVEKSYREGDFVLASGRRSDYYFDCRVTALHAEGSWLIGTLFNDLLKDVPVVGVGGMTMGADPLVSATTAISHELGRPLNGLLVRKEAKDHGTGQFVEGLGNFKPGDKVAMLEDVVTTGGSVFEVMEMLKNYGAEVVAVASMVDRSNGTVDFGVPFVTMLRADVKSYEADECPLCKAGMGAPVKPGSRNLK